MSSHPVLISEIDKIMEHPNADRLELAIIKGWQTVVAKGSLKPGDLVVYIPIDSILDSKLEELLFPPDSKVTLNKSRVRSIKIRGALSQGMALDLNSLIPKYLKLGTRKVGDDVADIIGVTKYEPPAPNYQQRGPKRKGSYKNHPMFAKYTDIENFKHYPNLFAPEDMVTITEKLHGTSARYGLYPRNTHHKLGWFTKILIKLGFKSENEFVYGSRNIQLQTGGKVFYDSNVYADVAKRLDLENKLLPGESLYGEIVGAGIQKNYHYGFPKESLGFFAYDVKVGERYLDVVEFRRFCVDRGIPAVPVLFDGPMGKANVDELRSGPSRLAPKAQPVTEGVVIRPMVEERSFIGRKILKYINDEYLLKDQSDHH